MGPQVASAPPTGELEAATRAETGYHADVEDGMWRCGVFFAAIGCTGGQEPGAEQDSGADATTGTAAVCTDLDLTVEIGGGETSFLPLAPGDPVRMVHGPQGGWHVDVSGRVGNTRQTISVRPSLVVEATGEILAGDQVQEYVALAQYDELGCEGQFWGRRAFLDDPPDIGMPLICGLHGVTATLSVEVVDPEDGRAGVGSIPVTLEVDPVDQPDCP